MKTLGQCYSKYISDHNQTPDAENWRPELASISNACKILIYSSDWKWMMNNGLSKSTPGEKFDVRRSETVAIIGESSVRSSQFEFVLSSDGLKARVVSRDQYRHLMDTSEWR